MTLHYISTVGVCVCSMSVNKSQGSDREAYTTGFTINIFPQRQNFVARYLSTSDGNVFGLRSIYVCSPSPTSRRKARILYTIFVSLVNLSLNAALTKKSSRLWDELDTIDKKVVLGISLK